MAIRPPLRKAAYVPGRCAAARLCTGSLVHSALAG